MCKGPGSQDMAELLTYDPDLLLDCPLWEITYFCVV